MNVVCEKCKAVYELDPAQIQGASVRVKCSSCGHLFRVYKNQAQENNETKKAPELLKDWIIRHSDGATSQVPDLATLQKWVVEGKVHRLDEMSQDGQHWRKLGEVDELQPFFQLLDKVGPANPLATNPPPSASPVNSDLSIDPTTQLSPKSTIEFGLSQDFIEQHLKKQQESYLQIGTPQQEDDPKTIKMAEPIMPVVTETADIAPDPIEAPQDSFEASFEQNATMNDALPRAPLDEQSSPFASPPSSTAQAQEYLDIAVTNQSTLPSQKSKPPKKALTIEQTTPSAEHETFVPPTPKKEEKPYSSSGEWFMGPTDIVQERSDPSLSIPKEEDLRDFSSFNSENDLPQYGRDSFDDDFDFGVSTQRKKWPFVLLALLLILGGTYLAAPSLFTSLKVTLGLIDYHPDAMKKLEQARSEIHRFSPAAFQKSKKLTLDAISIQGNPFAPQEALLALINFNRAEFFFQQLHPWKQKLDSLKQKVQKLSQALKALDPKDKEKKQKEEALKKQLELLAKQQDQAESHSQKFNAEYEKYRDNGKNILTKVQSNKKALIYERLGLLHLTSFALGARESFEKLLKETRKKFSKPQWTDELDRLEALFLMRQGRYERSLWFVSKLLKKHKNWILMKFLKARLLILKGSPEKALQLSQHWKANLQKHPLFMELIKELQDWQKQKAQQQPQATQKTQTGTQASPSKTKKRHAVPHSFAALFRIAERLRKRERLRRALHYYRLALKKKKTSRVFSGMAWCLLDIGQVGRAKRYFNRAITMNHRNRDAYYGLGLVYRRMKQISKAKAMFHKYLSRFPNGPDAAEIRGILRSM